jgi:hypothetical protein
MSEHKSPLHERVHARFKEVFGEPDNRLAGDHHWSLRRQEHPLHTLSINVLVNGSAQMPAVWVFDPYDHKDGVMRVGIKDEDHIEQVIAEVEARVERAATPRLRAT